MTFKINKVDSFQSALGLGEEMKKILIIEESVTLRNSLAQYLYGRYHILTAATSKEAIQLLESEFPAVMVIGEMDSFRDKFDLYYSALLLENPPYVIFLLPEREFSEAKRVFNLGRTDFAPVPIDFIQLSWKIEQSLKEEYRRVPVSETLFSSQRAAKYQGLIHSPRIPFSVLPLVQRAIRLTVPVLLRGERGTGKESLAKIIHYNSVRKDTALLTIHCQGLTEEKLVTSLQRISSLPPHFPDPRTLFLREVGQLSLSLQRIILEIVEEGIVLVDGTKEVAVDLRTLASSSEDLEGLIAQGQFLEDLFYRLGILPIYLTPLRERWQEIPSIAEEILQETAQKMGIPSKEISPEAVETLKEYYWSGNLWELESVLYRTMSMVESDIISSRDLLIATGPIQKDLPKKPVTESAETYKIYPGGKQVESSEDVLFFPEEGKPFQRWATKLAHDLKNPLSSIKSFTELLSQKFDDPHFRDEYYKMVKKDVDRMDEVVERVAGLSEEKDSKEGVFNIHEVLESAIEDINQTCQEKKIMFFRQFDTALPLIKGNATRCTRLFQRLFNIVVEFVPEGGDIYCRTKYTSVPAAADPHSPSRDLFSSVRVVISFSLPTGISWRESMEAEMSTWHQLLFSSGGEMELDEGSQGEGKILLSFPTE